MCVVAMATGARYQPTVVPFTCLACNAQDNWLGHFGPQHLTHVMFCVRCDVCEEMFTTLPGASEHFLSHLVESRVQPLMGLWLHPVAAYVRRALGPIASAAAPTRSSAVPLPPITLLYMTASHLACTANQLAASTAIAGPTRGTMSADADASFRRHLSICFPEGLLDAESMTPAQIATVMIPRYDNWLRQARSAMGYPPTSQ